MFQLFIFLIGAIIVFGITYYIIFNKTIEINMNQRDAYNEYPPKLIGCIFGACSVGLYYLIIGIFY